MAREDVLRIEIVHATRDEQVVCALEVPRGATVIDAVRRSGATADEGTAFGIYGRRVRADTLLEDGDRVEIYRPLVADPKVARRRRVKR